MQGDIVSIYSSNKVEVVQYRYDAWGNTVSITGSLASTIGQINPFRYRGYYYDTETGFFYVGSRYYDPEIGRFINADIPEMAAMGLFTGDVLSTNLFAYCVNNPVMNYDPTGYWVVSLSTVVVGFALDFLITAFLPYIFTAFKATKLAAWAKASKFFSKIYNNAIAFLSKGIYNAMDRILYNIMGKAANAATKAFTLSAIQKWVGDILNFSIGYGIAWLIDRFDRDGPSGYIRF